MSDLYKSLNYLDDIGMWEWPEDAREWIEEGLADKDPETRKTACHAASQDVDDDLARQLMYLVRQDEDAEVAGAAAIALGPALEMWDADRDFDDLDMDLDEEGLSESTAQDIMSGLKMVYEDTDRPKLTRRRCLEAVVRAPITWQPNAVSACYRSEDSDWVKTAVFCMGFIADFDDEILEQLKSTDVSIKREALRAAGRSCLEKAGNTIMDVASDLNEEKEIRLAALEALASVEPRNSDALLEKLAKHDDEDIAAMAEYALNERRFFRFEEDEDEDW